MTVLRRTTYLEDSLTEGWWAGLLVASHSSPVEQRIDDL